MRCNFKRQPVLPRQTPYTFSFSFPHPASWLFSYSVDLILPACWHATRKTSQVSLNAPSFLLLLPLVINVPFHFLNSRLYFPLHATLSRARVPSRAHLHLLYGLVIARSSIGLLAFSLQTSFWRLLFYPDSLLCLLRDTTWSLPGKHHGQSTKRYVPL